MVDSLTSESNRGRDERLRLVGVSDLTKGKAEFLKFFVVFRSREIVKSLLRALDFKYYNEKPNSQKFVSSKFRGNTDEVGVLQPYPGAG